MCSSDAGWSVDSCQAAHDEALTQLYTCTGRSVYRGINLTLTIHRLSSCWRSFLFLRLSCCTCRRPERHRRHGRPAYVRQRRCCPKTSYDVDKRFPIRPVPPAVHSFPYSTPAPAEVLDRTATRPGYRVEPHTGLAPHRHRAKPRRGPPKFRWEPGKPNRDGGGQGGRPESPPTSCRGTHGETIGPSNKPCSGSARKMWCQAFCSQRKSSTPSNDQPLYFESRLCVCEKVVRYLAHGDFASGRMTLCLLLNHDFC